MTVLATGACMLITAAAQSDSKSPGLLRPLGATGERSYEIYLTHMFIVFAFFNWFTQSGKPMNMARLFASTIVVAAALGALAARFYSERLNARIRRQFEMSVTNQPETQASAASS